MLKYVRNQGTLSSMGSPLPVITRKTSFLNAECGYSKATVIFKHVSIPLVWPSSEYLNTRREPRTFTVQLIFTTSDGREIISKPIEGVERTQIDVVFDQIFYINSQSPDFDIEVKVLCKRTDAYAQTMIHTLSKSVSRSLGYSFKKYAQSFNSSTLKDTDKEYIANYRNPENMVMVGSANFYLKNASLSGKTHNYTLHLHPQPSVIPQSHVLPLFGRISAQVLVQPVSLSQPLAQGTLDLFYDEGGILLQQLFCVLQGTLLKCYNMEPSKINAATKPDMKLPIDNNCTIETTAFPTSLRLRLHDPSYSELKNFMVIASTKNSYLGWKNAFKMQIKDAELWDGFASLKSNMHGAALPLLPPKSVRFDNVMFNTTPILRDDTPTRYGFELQSTRKRPPLPFKGTVDKKEMPRNTVEKDTEEGYNGYPEVDYEDDNNQKDTVEERKVNGNVRENGIKPQPARRTINRSPTNKPKEVRNNRSDTVTSTTAAPYILSLKIGDDEVNDSRRQHETKHNTLTHNNYSHNYSRSSNETIFPSNTVTSHSAGILKYGLNNYYNNNKTHTSRTAERSYNRLRSSTYDGQESTRL